MCGYCEIYERGDDYRDRKEVEDLEELEAVDRDRDSYNEWAEAQQAAEMDRQEGWR